MFLFGSGALFGTRTDVANATPIEFATLQECQIDISFSNKELYGQRQFPVAVARGEGKISGKSKFANVKAAAYADLFFGTSLTAGETRTSYMETGTVGSSAPNTVTVGNSAKFVNDLGVVYASSGIALVQVASAPSQGQYSVAAGVYTFNASDAGVAVLISYDYTATGAGTGSSLTISNQLLGSAPQFRANFYSTYQGKQINLQLNCCTSEKLSLQTKTTDFVIPEMDFSAFADAAGNIGILSFGDA